MYDLIFKIIFICIFTSILSLVIKNTIISFSPILIVSAGIICFCIVLPHISAVIRLVNELMLKSEGLNECVKATFKVISISVLCEFSSQICADAGDAYLASKINFAGKTVIICICAPLISALITTVTNMISVL